MCNSLQHPRHQQHPPHPSTDLVHAEQDDQGEDKPMGMSIEAFQLLLNHIGGMIKQSQSLLLAETIKMISESETKTENRVNRVDTLSEENQTVSRKIKE